MAGLNFGPRVRRPALIVAVVIVVLGGLWALTWAETRLAAPVAGDTGQEDAVIGDRGAGGTPGASGGNQSTGQPNTVAFTVECLDVPDVRLPQPADGLVHYLTFEPHRFRLTFARPMGHSSVEAAVVKSFEPWSLATGDFAWADDQTMEFTLQPPAEHACNIAPWCPDFFHESTQDFQMQTKDGQTVTLDGYLAFQWGFTYRVRRVPAGNPAGQAQKVFACPAGVIPLSYDRAASNLLSVQFALAQHYAEMEEGSLMMPHFPLYAVWLRRSSDGRWTDLAEEAAGGQGAGGGAGDGVPGSGLAPVSWVTWLTDGSLTATEWEGQLRSVYGLEGRETQRMKMISVPEGYWPAMSDPVVAGGDLVVWLHKAEPLRWPPPPVPQDLAVTDLAGAVRTQWSDVSRFSLPHRLGLITGESVAALPGGGSVMFAGKPATISGPTAYAPLTVLDLATGQTRVVPGSETTLRYQGGAMVAFSALWAGSGGTGIEGAPVLAACLAAEEGSAAASTLNVFDLGAATLHASFSISELGLQGMTLPDTGFGYPILVADQCLPSADGRYLAVSLGTRDEEGTPRAVAGLTAVIDLKENRVLTPTPLTGKAIGWSPDGSWLYLAEPSY